ncbi:MAG: A/G-specific adenine glycosylase [Tahibacter sp.]
MSQIAPALLAWFAEHGRHDLPWQHPRSAYRVWLSEIMLQQTQVATAKPYFERFVAALPSLDDLAAAEQDQVLALWSGLGYYSRARNLHRAAQICIAQHDGELPRDFEALSALPGIGRSTAGAILAQAHGLPIAILDGNVKRVLSRYFGVDGWPGSTATSRTLWNHAEAQTPDTQVADYTQAIMDLGATVCVRSRPHCARCPLQSECVASRDGLTTQLPARKPGKAIPTRSTCMLIVRDEHGRVLLQRRPPSGVWASLWSLPEAIDRDLTSRILVGLGGAGATLQAMPAFTHTFSHFHLQVQPLLAAVRQQDAVADSPDQRWCDERAIAALGLPAPVRKLLSGLAPAPENDLFATFP